MSLSDKSDEEISELLTQYGIDHGPIVESTRSLYERKLQEAMDADQVETPSDKTYYREEEEEITYITHHSEEGGGDLRDTLRHRGQTEPEEPEVQEQSAGPPLASAVDANHSAAQPTGRIRQSGGCVSVLVGLLTLALFAVAVYYAYCYIQDSNIPSDQVRSDKA